jgi:hypothetical protein
MAVRCDKLTMRDVRAARAVSKKDEGVVDLCADYALDDRPSTGGSGRPDPPGQLPTDPT